MTDPGSLQHRAVVLRALVALPLVGLLVVGLVVGVHDALAAPWLGARILGLVLAMVSVALVLGIAFLFISATTQRWAVYCIASGAVAGGIYLTLQLTSHESAPWLTVLWSAAVLYPLGLAGYLWLGGARRSARTPGRLAVIISVVTVVLGAWQGLYSVAYAPLKHPDTVQVDVTTSPVPDARAAAQNYVAVRSTYKIRNEGDAKLLIIGSVYALVGVTAHLGNPGSGNPFDVDRLDRLRTSGAWAGRYESSDDLEPVEVGTDPLGVGGWIDAGGEQDGDVLSYVPAATYNSYYFFIQVATVRADRLSLPGFYSRGRDKQRPAGGSYLYVDYDLQQTALSRLTQGRRYLEVQYSLTDGDLRKGSVLTAYVSSTGHAFDTDYQGQLGDYYGMFFIGGGATGTASSPPASPAN